MNEQKDNINNEGERFLKKLKQKQADNLDDFEKEALEGFAMLENEEEAIQLKTSLDKKIFSEVIAGKEKSNKKIWYAAAGLIFFIGISVFFIFNGNINSEKNKLAITTTNNAPADSAPSDLNQSKSIVTSTDAIDLEKEMTKKSTISSLNEQLAYKNIPKINSGSGAKPNEQAENQTSLIAKQTSEEHLAPNELSENEDLDTKKMNSRENEQSTDKTNALVEKNVKTLEDLNLSSKTAVTEKTESKKAKNTFSQRTLAPPAQNNNSTYETPVAAAMETTPGFVTYTGGNEVLLKDLKLGLKAMKIKKSFEVILLISKNAKIESVTFLNKNKLTKNELEEVTKVLRNLNKFQVSGETGTSGFFRYLINYEP